MIRLAQIGTDHMHAAAYRETLALFPDRIEVVGLVRGQREVTGAELGPDAEVPVFDSIDELLAAVTIDAAQVMLPNNEMGVALTTLAQEGIHLWAEKPVARRASDLAPVAELVRSKGLAFTAGYQARFQPTTSYARRMVREGLLGPLTFAHMTTTTTTIELRDPDGPYGHLFDDEVSGGGIFHWLGCHMLDLLLTITEAVPESVQALTATVGTAEVKVEDVGSATLRFRDGWLASLNYGYLLPTAEASPFGNDEPEPGIYGQQGWVRWNNHTQVLRSYSQHPAMVDAPWQQHDLVSPNPGGYGRAAYLAMTNFLDAIDGLVEPVYTVEQAMLVLHLIESIYASARTRGPVPVEAALAGAYCSAEEGNGDGR